jgi:hypothetical protein
MLNGSLCGKDLVVFKFNITSLIETCTAETAIDTEALKKYLEFSVTQAPPVDPMSLIEAAKSATNIGAEYKSIIATSDDINAGFADSTPSPCELRFTHSPWVLSYYGFKIPEDNTTVNYLAIASKKIIEILEVGKYMGHIMLRDLLTQKCSQRAI